MQLKPATPDKKSVFVKKSMSLSHGKHDFKFNFDITPEDSTGSSNNISNEDDLKEVDTKSKEESNKCQYVPTNNTFRFNFDNGSHNIDNFSVECTN